ncbi:hypothetical protein MP228_007939 [Amoeboaphelidium protococcarum]|nr:hypothetical protein MP228_007939 [Amoeboaphelidium protococcarum]
MLRTAIKSKISGRVVRSRWMSMVNQKIVVKDEGAVDMIEECAIPLQKAINMLQALSLQHQPPSVFNPVTYQSTIQQKTLDEEKLMDVALNFYFSSSDSNVKDLKGSVVMPHRFMKTRILAFTPSREILDQSFSGCDTADASLVKKQLDSGDALIITSRQELDRLISGSNVDKLAQFNKVICHPDFMKTLLLSPQIDANGEPLPAEEQTQRGGYARVLGPLNLMPSQRRTETMSENVVEAIARSLKQQMDVVVYKVDHNSFLSVLLGRFDLDRSDDGKVAAEQIYENCIAFIDHLKSSKKGKQRKYLEKLEVQTRFGFHSAKQESTPLQPKGLKLLIDIQDLNM